MLVNFCHVLGAALVGTAALALSGQTIDPPASQPSRVEGNSTHPARVEAYSAEFKIVSAQTLADGTTISRETKDVEARDSQGRSLHVTTQSTSPAASGGELTRGRIENPVDNVNITWDSQRKQATVMKLPPGEQRYGCWKSESGRLTLNYGRFNPASAVAPKDRPGLIVGGESTLTESVGSMRKQQQKHKDLGTTMIQGLEARGERWTTVIPAGEIGNDRPITTMRETWRATGFPLTLREISIDPRMGKRTRETVSLTLGEPDLSMFQPPEGYPVVTEEMHEVECQP